MDFIYPARRRLRERRAHARQVPHQNGDIEFTRAKRPRLRHGHAAKTIFGSIRVHESKVTTALADHHPVAEHGAPPQRPALHRPDIYPAMEEFMRTT